MKDIDPTQWSLGAERASQWAGREELLMIVLIALTVVFTSIVGIMILILAIRYRRGSKVDRSRPINTDHRLEITWSVIPLILGIGVFIWGAKLFAEVRNPPKDAEEVLVVGKRWMWHIQHSNGVRENNELHVPIGRAIKLTMISQDVVHDFFIPAMRLHQDVIPGHYTEEWFTADRIGTYHLFCAQYCGTNHSEMIGWVYVMDPADYAVWLRNAGVGPQNRSEAAAQTPEQAGEALYDQLACGNCHGAVDAPHGPSLVGIFGRQRRLTNGQTVIADDQYLRESIVDPYAKIVDGYGPTMPEYKIGSDRAELSEEKLHNLMAYIKSLGPGAVPVGKGKPGTVPGGNTVTPVSREPQTGVPTGQPEPTGNTGNQP